ncbi:MAG: type IX secretion system sortase PorU [Tannerella sp.]|nr:type IX secretion system sortase PorU [Tannerella sp.]
MITIPVIHADASIYADKSVLSEGKWVKIKIDKTGFYKLTYAELKKRGFSNPENVSIHGYGGFPMEENFSKATYIDDLPSVPVWRGSDYLIFYGKGLVKWTYNTIYQFFEHENNTYSNYASYFVTDATGTNNVSSIESSSIEPAVEIDAYDDYMLHEKELVAITNPGRPYSGRELFGESFDSNISQNFDFTVPGITGDDVMISYRFVAKLKYGPGVVSLKANDNLLSENTISDNTATYVAALAISPNLKWSGNTSENIRINLSFSLSSQTSHLDYIRLTAKRQLKSYETFTPFRSIGSINKASRFKIKDYNPNQLIFEVTEGRDVQLINPVVNGTEASFVIDPATTLREFAIVDISKNLPSPEIAGDVESQNLHGMSQTDMIILAPAAFVSDAERLAAVHRAKSGISVSVVTPGQVYNEFSSGSPEATAIRRFMKMFYDRRSSDEDAPKYLLLFGDGMFDNRRLTSQWNTVTSDNYLLTYQSEDGIGEGSYVSDDYFGLLHDNEGGNIITASIDLGIGRFPVSTVTQAKNAVDKVISYIENTTLGMWRNRLCFVADDGNTGDTFTINHMAQSYSLTRYLEENHPQYMSRKLFFDAFKKDNTGGRASYPDVKNNIQKELKNGILLINYTGHGDAVSWSEEKVVEQSDIVNASYSILPLWITAACDFAPFDAAITSAGEDVFLNKSSGGIALYTTARVAYSLPNLTINMYYIRNLFEKQNGRHLTLGEVNKNMKNSFRSGERASFILLGDPALTLAFPDEYKMEITEINNTPVTGEAAVNIKALEKVTVKGHILNSEGSEVNDFNGLFNVSVYDSEDTVRTLVNNKESVQFKYPDYTNTLYTGNDSVSNGEFSFSFTVPKDIKYSGNKGKISLYAADGNNRRDASGAFKNFTVKGTADVSNLDTVGPEIRQMYMNTADFTNGDRVNDTPLLCAIVWDESGVNMSGSLGHNITLTIDDNPVLSYSLNDYYENYLSGEAGEGIVKFPVPRLEEGVHKAELKILDIHNNSSTGSISFKVADNYIPTIIKLIAAPSPAREYVNFLISHNIPETFMKIKVEVYDLQGRLQWKNEESGSSQMFESYRMRWNLTNGSGARVNPGIYVYRAIISTNNSKEASSAGKLIVLRQ